jgi:peptidyl-prolyl cis-trans isomerase C
MGMSFKHGSRPILIFLALLCLALPVLAAERPTIGAVAVVNGAVIPRGDLDRETERLQRRGARHKSASVAHDDIRRLALDNLIQRELLFQESRREGITVDEATVDRELARLRLQVGGGAALAPALDALHVTEGELRRDIARGMAIQRYIDGRFTQRTAVTDLEVRAYYDGRRQELHEPRQVAVSHLLVKIGSDWDAKRRDEARQELDGIRGEVLAGGDFAELARRFSACPSASRGGDLGFFRQGELARPLDEAAFALGEGEVSSVIEDHFGYHLLKVTAVKPERTPTLEEVRAEITQRLQERKSRKELLRHLEELRHRAAIELVTGEAVSL